MIADKQRQEQCGLRLLSLNYRTVCMHALGLNTTTSRNTQTLRFPISKSVLTLTVHKGIWAFPNQKPWMTSEVQTLLTCHNTAFRPADRSQYSEAKVDLKKGINEAKSSCKRKTKEHFTEDNPRKMWQGIQHITNRNTNNQVSGNVEELNYFFARFEAERTKISSICSDTSDPPPSRSSSTVTL